VKICIYALFDAEKPDEIKYVGQTTNLISRFRCHRYGRDQATWKWAKAVEDRGGIVSVKVLQMCESKPKANNAEQEWIGKVPHLLNNHFKAPDEFQVPSDELITLDELEGLYVKWAKLTFRNDAQFLINALGMNAQLRRKYFTYEDCENYKKAAFPEQHPETVEPT
jgi:hypothetical protein